MSKKDESPFSVRTLYLLIAVSVLSLLFGFGLAIFNETSPTSNVDSNSYSRSALGHNAFVRFLRELQIPTLVSQNQSGQKAESALLVLLEPSIHSSSRNKALQMLDSADTVLVVLPKWHGAEDNDKTGHIAAASLVDAQNLNEVLSLFASGATVIRPKKLRPMETIDGLAITPTLASPQFLRSDSLEGLIENEDGILLGWVSDSNIAVLSDPDVLNNHGLDNGNNAALIAAIINELRGEGPIIIDETLHGFTRKPDLWHALFEMPFVLVTLQILLCTGLIIWSGTKRFGKAKSRGRAFLFGTDFLILNTAKLMRLGGHSKLALLAYRDTTLRTVARKLHSHTDISLDRLQDWLAATETARSVSKPLSTILSEIDEVTTQKSPQSTALLAAANSIYTWKEEILHGPTSR